LNQIERRRSAMAENAVLIEKHNFDGYLDRLSAAEERRWLDYGRRLMVAADATFDGEAQQ
jgi:hypothetical protein